AYRTGDRGAASTLKELGLWGFLVPKTARLCCNPFRVGKLRGRFPRVARSSQPWAGGQNPFRIGLFRIGNMFEAFISLLHLLGRRRWLSFHYSILCQLVGDGFKRMMQEIT